MGRVFRDRADAGRALADLLLQELPDLLAESKSTLVLGLARGGIPVAAELARKIGCEFDALIVRKLGMPFHEELAFGAIAPGGCMWLNQDLIQLANLSEQQISEVLQRERQELVRREEIYFRGRSPKPAREKSVILVDDGIATGATMRVAVEFAKTSGARRIIVAVPVSTFEAKTALALIVDRFLCPMIPDDFSAVGQFYETFEQVSDDEVWALLESNES